MTIVELLSYLHRLDVRLWVEGEWLRYSAPKGALDPDLRNQLRERKAEIIALLQKASHSTGSALPPIRPVPRHENLPLSFAQQRLWFLNHLDENAAHYNIPIAWRLQGPLNLVALEQSLSQVVRRHEVLRTRFPLVSGQPVQAIGSAEPRFLPLIDLGSLEARDQQAEVHRLAGEQTERPFDLANDPVVRFNLLRLARQSHVLLVTIHHIVFDGWSLGIFVRELTSSFSAFCTGRPSPMPELPIQYADFAIRQRQWLEGKVMKAQLAYWKERLGGAPPELQLPADGPRPPVQTFRGRLQPFQLPGESLERLKRLGQSSGATLFMILLSAFKTLLHRYSGQQDIVIGSPIANRNREELAPLIGFFANTLVLRTDLSGDPPFIELLHRVRETAMGAFAHQDIPFEKLVEGLQPERELSRHPLIQALFILQNASTAWLKLPGLRLAPLETELETVRFDLEIHVWEVPQGLRGFFMYNPDLFAAATMARMAKHFQTLLESIIADPNRRLSELPLMTECEQQQVLLMSRAMEPEASNRRRSVQPETLSDEQVRALLDEMFAAAGDGKYGQQSDRH